MDLTIGIHVESFITLNKIKRYPKFIAKTYFCMIIESFLPFCNCFKITNWFGFVTKFIALLQFCILNYSL